MVGTLTQLTRSVLTPHLCRASLMYCTVAAMHFLAEGWGVKTTALPDFREMRDL